MQNSKLAKGNRKARAEERQKARDARTNEEQLDVLRSRGITSGREWDRLSKGVK